jgi:hypothetical protein
VGPSSPLLRLGTTVSPANASFLTICWLRGAAELGVGSGQAELLEQAW